MTFPMSIFRCPFSIFDFFVWICCLGFFCFLRFIVFWELGIPGICFVSWCRFRRILLWCAEKVQSVLCLPLSACPPWEVSPIWSRVYLDDLYFQQVIFWEPMKDPARELTPFSWAAFGLMKFCSRLSVGYQYFYSCYSIHFLLWPTQNSRHSYFSWFSMSSLSV